VDILHGYMDGNLPALLVGRATGRPVAWGIRRSNGDPSGADARSLAMQRWMVRLSRFADLIIFNSQAGLETHRALGMGAPRMTVIPNGFDTNRFAPDPVLRREQRAAWGAPEGVPLIGLVGRLNPVKGHATFLKAAARLAETHPTARFVCVGGGSASYTAEMKQLATDLGLQDRVLWAGATEHMAAAYNALDLLALASLEEGFPNVLGEAMACGIPCVATRVGDAEVLIGPTGRTVPPGDAVALAQALVELLDESAEARAHRGVRCRERVVQSYRTEILARRTEQALSDLAARSDHAPLTAERS
jgi:glycosyltransferase involved in cell wall biosynthesis